MADEEKKVFSSLGDATVKARVHKDDLNGTPNCIRNNETGETKIIGVSADGYFEADIPSGPTSKWSWGILE